MPVSIISSYSKYNLQQKVSSKMKKCQTSGYDYGALIVVVTNTQIFINIAHAGICMLDYQLRTAKYIRSS